LISDCSLKDSRFAKFWRSEICGNDLRFTDKKFKTLGDDWDLRFAHDWLTDRRMTFFMLERFAESSAVKSDRRVVTRFRRSAFQSFLPVVTGRLRRRRRQDDRRSSSSRSHCRRRRSTVPSTNCNVSVVSFVFVTVDSTVLLFSAFPFYLIFEDCFIVFIVLQL
jgi:hypothetical protein